MNRVVLIGRRTKDPELKYTPGAGKAVCTFNLAVDRRVLNKDGQREADFVPVVAWGKIAENVANYCSKGRLVGVSGRLQIRSYDGKDDIKRTVTEVIAEEVQFLERIKGAVPVASSEKYDDMNPIEDGEIPF
jgi:single-strand DNA-binding protein